MSSSSEIKLGERLARARQIKRAEYKQGEIQKLGTLRAGSSGIMSQEGQIAGACHRKTHLRQLGVEADPPNTPRLMMFEAGYESEDSLARNLTLSLEPGEILLREEEIPVSWITQSGITVSGRPDLVICSSDRKPILGIECKSVHSVWTSRKVLFESQPKMDNLIQAAHYMWKLDVPWKLVYRQSSNQAMPEFAHKLLPAPGQPNSEYIEYNDKGKPKHVKQFEIIYDLKLDETGRLHYKLETADQWVATLVTTSDITRYFEYVSTMQTSKQLGPRPLTISATGEKENYSNCGYCPLQEICDRYEDGGYTEWLQKVNEKLQENIK